MSKAEDKAKQRALEKYPANKNKGEAHLPPQPTRQCDGYSFLISRDASHTSPSNTALPAMFEEKSDHQV